MGRAPVHTHHIRQACIVACMTPGRAFLLQGAPGLEGIPDRLRGRLGVARDNSLPAPSDRAATAGEGAAGGAASGELRRTGSAAGGSGGGRERGAPTAEGGRGGGAPARGRHSRVVYEEAAAAPAPKEQPRERRSRR